MKPLRIISNFQYKNYNLMIILSLLFTVFMLIGASKIYMESDITNEFPQDLPIFKASKEISDLYGTGDSILITIKLDDSYDGKNKITDIRDPFVIQSLMLFEELLKEESAVDSVTSASMFFKNKYFFTTDDVKTIIEDNPAPLRFFNKDYTATLMIVSASIGKDTTKIQKMIERFEEDRDVTVLPPGMKITITGSPFITNIILTLLQKDAIFTTSLAAFVILILLFILQRSFTKGMLVFIPLMLGLIWTLGTLGWLNIPISVATVGVGAMILGLGVEYGIFVVSRYNEERVKYKQGKALEITVEEVGSSILGSGITTIIGFLALTLSVMPMMQHLGQSLALGIFYSLLAALLVNPAFIIFEENLEKKLMDRTRLNLVKKEEKVSLKK